MSFLPPVPFASVCLEVEGSEAITVGENEQGRRCITPSVDNELRRKLCPARIAEKCLVAGPGRNTVQSLHIGMTGFEFPDTFSPIIL